MTLTVHMIGNAHLDPVWLWPWQEGLDEALATFRSAADRCEEYPEFIFTRGEAWQYEKLLEIDPDLFERVRRLAAAGQWCVAGGQFIQPDLNGPTAESHRRQFSRGLSFFEKHFGVQPRSALNVDSFGHPASYPDILAPFGIEGYSIQRPKAYQMDLPQVFLWRGCGGGELITFRMSMPYTSMTTGELSAAVEAAIRDTGPGLSHTMCFYGIGNHGGGPSKAQIEWILEHRRFREGVELVFSTPDRYFDAVRADKGRMTVITGDLQHCFPGCYSVMHDIHQTQRLGELQLVQSERLADWLCAEPAERADYARRLDRAWDDLLFTAFHDILAGTSVRRSWGSVRAMQGRALITAEEVSHLASRRWARRRLGLSREHRHIVLNPAPYRRTGMIEIEPWLEDYANWDDRWVSNSAGEPIEFQLIQPEANIRSRILAPIDLGPFQHEALLIQPGPPPASAYKPSPIPAATAGEGVLANSRLQVVLGEGGLGAIMLDGEPILSDRGFQLILRDDPLDCWGMTSDRHTGEIAERWNANDWVIEETGPLRAQARLEGRIGTSRVRLQVSLERSSPAIDISLMVNFDERHRLLQACLHWSRPAISIIDGLPGGWIERPRTETEWPFQAFSLHRMTGVEAALLSHDTYSLSHREDASIISLLRAPIMASAGNTPAIYHGRDDHTDQGVHEFRMRLVVGENLEPADLVAAAEALALPPISFDFYEGMNRPLPPAANPTPPRSMLKGTLPATLSGANRQ